jgi:hypothetical protein
LTLRHAGAAAVSVVVIGRWLNRRNPLSARLIEDGADGDYDPLFCPVTAGRCPVSAHEQRAFRDGPPRGYFGRG